MIVTDFLFQQGFDDLGKLMGALDTGNSGLGLQKLFYPEQRKGLVGLRGTLPVDGIAFPEGFVAGYVFKNGQLVVGGFRKNVFDILQRLSLVTQTFVAFEPSQNNTGAFSLTPLHDDKQTGFVPSMRIAGSGSVYYTGSAVTTDTTTAGSGRVHRVK